MTFWHLHERLFLLKIYQRGDCWEWRGIRQKFGHGIFRRSLAHRMAYVMAKGAIPAGYEIDHLCRHPWCVRPSHLEAVTPRVNNLRGTSPAAQNARKTHAPCGHPYDGVATRQNRRGDRYCRACTHAAIWSRQKARLAASPTLRARVREKNRLANIRYRARQREKPQ